MAHRHAMRWWSLRRLTALLAVVCLAGSWLELAIPDVHDSKASVVTQASPLEVAMNEHDPHTVDAPVPHPDNEQGSSHTFHVDHCAHGHFSLIQVSAASSEELFVESERPAARVVELSSVDLLPRFRPPIA